MARDDGVALGEASSPQGKGRDMHQNQQSKGRRRGWAALAWIPAAALIFGGMTTGVGAQQGDVGTQAIRDTFPNPSKITINDDGQASPYPSVITVANLPKRLYDVNVELRGIRHDRPDDIDIMLVAPNGDRAIIMADAGGDNPISGVNITLDDETANEVPDSTPIRNGATYQPRNQPGGDVFNTSNQLLGTFDRINPNGDWKLYVYDDRSGNSGEIANGWALEIYYGEAPVANVDEYRAREGRRLRVSERDGVLANDTDGDPEPGVDSPLTARLRTDPRKGTVRLRKDGSFVYKPQNGFTGEDSFTYTVRDRDGLTDVGKVTITVRGR